MKDYLLSKETRQKMKNLEHLILEGKEPLESIIYDVQHTPQQGWFAYTWIGQKQIKITPCNYDYVGTIIHKSMHTPEVYELYKLKKK